MKESELPNYRHINSPSRPYSFPLKLKIPIGENVAFVLLCFILQIQRL